VEVCDQRPENTRSGHLPGVPDYFPTSCKIELIRVHSSVD